MVSAVNLELVERVVFDLVSAGSGLLLSAFRLEAERSKRTFCEELFLFHSLNFYSESFTTTTTMSLPGHCCCFRGENSV